MSAGTDILDRVRQEHALPSAKIGPELVTGSPESGPTRSKNASLGAVSGTASSSASMHWNPEEFANQQILSLVQRVFFPGWPRPSRQVVFSAVDGITDAGTVCARVSLAMAERVPGSVCAIEADSRDVSLQHILSAKQTLEIAQEVKDLKEGRPIRPNLWLLMPEEFYAGQRSGAAWLCDRLSELRRAFDYVVIHASAVGSRSETALIGQMTDGVILVVNGQDTRRAAARDSREILRAANARLLGVVISEREFPIPEAIYNKL